MSNLIRKGYDLSDMFKPGVVLNECDLHFLNSYFDPETGLLLVVKPLEKLRASLFPNHQRPDLMRRHMSRIGQVGSRQTFLTSAIESQNPLDAVRFLLALKVDPNAVDGSEEVPLTLAANLANGRTVVGKKDDWSVVTALLDAKADVALSDADQIRFNRTRPTPLVCAVMSGNIPMARRLLELGAKTNGPFVQATSRTVLYWPVFSLNHRLSGHTEQTAIEMIRLLLEHGAGGMYVRQDNGERDSPYLFAQKYGLNEVVELFDKYLQHPVEDQIEEQ